MEPVFPFIEGNFGAAVMVIAGLVSVVSQGLLVVAAAQVSSRWGYVVYFAPFVGAGLFGLLNPGQRNWAFRIWTTSTLIAIAIFILRALVPITLQVSANG